MRATRRLLFLPMSMVALMFCAEFGTQAQEPSLDRPQNAGSAQSQGPGHASQADRGKPQANGKPSVERKDRSRRSQKIPPSTAALPKGSPKQRVKHGDMVNSARHVQRAELLRPAAPSRDNMRHRGANAAFIGGSAQAAGKNAGAISGATIRRKP